MADPLRTEEERKKVTQKILNLTLEIIYLITGEDYSVVSKTSGDHVTPLTYSYISGEWTRNDRPIMEPPLYSEILEEKNTSKILTVINKITELLTAEVPIRCQDVTVYFSMEEWEYIEGHKDLYKDVMMQNQPPLTSPDGSSNKNTPERSPHPPYSQDSTQEHHKIPQNDEDKGLIVIEVEEETSVKADDPCKEEEDPQEISTDPQHNWSNVDKQPIIFPNDEVEEKKFTWESSEGNPFTSNLHLISYSADPSSDPSTQDPSSADLSSPITHTTGDQTFPCPECGKCYSKKEGLTGHLRIHTGVKQFSCPQCGKSFIYKSSLSRHERVHTGEKPYSCSECGKSFSQKNSLFTHERTHTGAKPYSCSVCGKCFRQSSALSTHERTHTGTEHNRNKDKQPTLFPDDEVEVEDITWESSEESPVPPNPYLIAQNADPPPDPSTDGMNVVDPSPHIIHHPGDETFPCPECGKCFNRKGGLIVHLRSHTGVKQFSCIQCGKSFIYKSSLSRHKRIHTGEKPYSCSECGKSFSQKNSLFTHERTHTGAKPYSCSICGKCFTDKSNLARHERVHIGDRPYSCSECGKEYSHKASLLSHVSSHI